MDKFNYEANGYNRSEVNNFVNDVIVQTENIVSKCREQGEQLEKLKIELAHYRHLENDLKETLIKAEKDSDNIKKMAREERNMIINDAKNNASRIVNEALLKADKTEAKREILEKNMKIFKRKLKLIMDQQLAVVEEIDTLEIEENNE